MKQTSTGMLLAALISLSACSHKSSNNNSDSSPLVFNDNTPISQNDARSAVTKLASLVRFYYPSDEVESADWDRVQAYAFHQTDKIKTRGELVHVLSDVFHPLAPAMSLNGYQRKTMPAATGTRVAWHYDGAYVARNWGECATDFGIPPDFSPYQVMREFASSAPSVYFPKQDRFKTTLEGGIEVTVPLILPAQNNHALPAGDALPAAVAAESITPGSEFANLSAAATIWAAYKNFFPYIPESGVDLSASLLPLLSDAASAGNFADLEHALKRFTVHFQDGHNFYIPNVDSDGSTTALGIFSTEWIDDNIVVTWLAPDYTGALRIGDVVTTIRGVTVADFMAQYAPYTPLAPEKKPIYLGLTWSSRGDAKLSFHVRHADNSEEDIVIQREAWSDSVYSKLASRALPIISEPESGIFVINERNELDIDAIRSQIAGAKAVILDTRHGLNLDSRPLASTFLSSGLHTQTYTLKHNVLPWQNDNVDEDSSFVTPPLASINPAKVIVIMSRHTQSSGESWLNFFKSMHAGTLIGEATHGANGDISCARVLGGSSSTGISVFFTGLHVANLDGTQHQIIGTLPDIEVRQTLAGVRAGHDELMDKAMELARAP